MFKPLILCTAVVLALGACSRSDDTTSSNASSPPPANSAAPEPAPQSSASDAAQAPAPPEQAVQPAPAATDESPPAPPQPSAPKQPRKHTASTARETARSTGTAHETAKGAGTNMLSRWGKVQAIVDRCDLESDRDVTHQCLEQARAAYRSAHVKCDALPSQPRQDCLALDQRLSSIAEGSSDASSPE